MKRRLVVFDRCDDQPWEYPCRRSPTRTHLCCLYFEHTGPCRCQNCGALAGLERKENPLLS